MSADDPWGRPVDLDTSDDEFWADQRAAAGKPNRGDRTWFDTTREQANTVPCRYCKRPPGKKCVDVGSHPVRELKHFPAHLVRVKDSGQTT